MDFIKVFSNKTRLVVSEKDWSAFSTLFPERESDLGGLLGVAVDGDGRWDIVAVVEAAPEGAADLHADAVSLLEDVGGGLQVDLQLDDATGSNLWLVSSMQGCQGRPWKS